MSAFTEDQRRAMDLRGNVLVVAGAGTGKTRTLVHRCVEWLLEPPGTNSLDQVLMVTFTEAAAAEMRLRIRDELKKRCEEEPRDERLLEQLALLETAFISTLHSFCLRLIRQHFYELNLDPQLAVLAEEEAHLLAAETLSKLLEKYYAGDSSLAKAVQGLIQGQARGWEAPVKRLILRLHQYAQTLPDPDGWLTAQRDLFSDPVPHQWRHWFQIALEDWRTMWLPVIRTAGGDTANVAECRAALEALPSKPTMAEARQALERIGTIYHRPWPRGSVKNFRDPIDQFFQEAEFLEGLTSPVGAPESGPGRQNEAPQSPSPPGQSTDGPALESEDPLAQDWSWVRGEMITLLELGREFGREFADAKRELGVVDFHDLEQFSLRLLWDAAGQRPTPLACEWRTKLRLIFVDEYQDINAAQDAILRALGSEGALANRFLVGDPKQSIYRFRLADPHIFQRYAEQWRHGGVEGQVVALTDNFRNREAILQFINSLFAVVMQTEIGGVQYDELAKLKFGNPAGRKELSLAGPEESKAATTGALSPAQDRPTAPSENTAKWNALVPPIELHLRLTAKGDSTSSTADEPEDSAGSREIGNRSNAELEARLVGLRLAELRATKRLIWDQGREQLRPVDWGDMFVLLRSPRAKAECYAKEFSRLDIPLVAGRGGFFESQEIMDLLSLLTLLDNPQQDVPLLAVLRSPFVALTFDQLGIVRLCSKGGLWTALHSFHRLFEKGVDHFDPGPAPAHSEAGPEMHGLRRLAAALADPGLRQAASAAWEKVDLFLLQFRRWRRSVRETSLSECLDEILREAHYTSFLLAQARGQQQRGNLAKLLTWARRFDQFQRQGLYQFLKFIEAQQEAQIDHEPAPVDAEQAVRLMSIHQSKGLEFPVVVLADLGKAFNLADLKAGIIRDQQYGLCPLIKPPFSEQRYPSLPYWLAQRRQRQEMLGEEVRLLYVAMTRACQCLILSGTTSRSAADKWPAQFSPPAIQVLLSAHSYLDWLGPWLCQQTGNPLWTQLAEGKSNALRWIIYEQGDARLEAAAPANTGPSSTGNAELDAASSIADSERVAARLQWKYPFETAVRQPAKVSVSTLRLGILAELDDTGHKIRRRCVLSSETGERLSATDVGSAHHAFLESVALDKVGDLGSLESEAERLQRAGVLSKDERRSLDLESIADFWGSPIGREILAHREHLHREMPFTSRLSLAELDAFKACARAAVANDSAPAGAADAGRAPTSGPGEKWGRPCCVRRDRSPRPSTRPGIRYCDRHRRFGRAFAQRTLAAGFQDRRRSTR